jgi:CRISPR/Cas system CMR-associated protein Cmr5 small subunit
MGRKSLVGRCRCVFLVNSLNPAIVAYRKNKNGKWDSVDKYGELNPNRLNDPQSNIENWLRNGQVVKQGRRRFKQNPAKKVVKPKVVKVATPKVDYNKPFIKPKVFSTNSTVYAPMFLWVHTSPNQGIAINLIDGEISVSCLQPHEVLNGKADLMENSLAGPIKLKVSNFKKN